jgi:cell division protein ZapD
MIPKISANRYLLSVRFSGANFGNGPIAEIPEVMPFRLGLCNM